MSMNIGTMMKVSRLGLCAAAIVGLTACPAKKSEDGASSASASGAQPPPSATVAAPPVEAKPTIEPRVKAEVDAKPDGTPGTPISAAGAIAALQVPKDWPPQRGELTVVNQPTKKTQIVVGAIGPDGPAGKLATAATTLGLTDCQWGAPEPVVVGKTKLASTAADGVCKRGPAVVRTAYVATNAEKLLVIGAWEPDGDPNAVFGAMRTIAKPTVDPLAACCAALRQNARSAPPDQQASMLQAANMCDAMRLTPQGRQAINQMRAALRGANMPASCR